MSIRKNFIHLFIVQVSNYIFPLITLPYLGRVLGVESFGHLVFATAVVQYFIFITDYGFSLSATRAIAINKKNPEAINDIFSSVLYAKILLMLICFMLISFVPLFLPSLSLTLLYISFLSVIGNIIFPFWFFQGIERVKEISYLTTISKFLVLLGVFAFVKTKSDINLAAFFQSSSVLISGFFSLIYIKKKSLVTLCKPSISGIKREFVNGFSLFLSTMATSLYTTLNIIVLGFYSTPIVLGNFGAADKLRNALQSMLFPLHQVIYPRASQEIHEGHSVKKVLSRYGYFIAIQGLVISICIYFFGEFATRIYYGDKYTLAPHYFKMLSSLPFIVSLAVVFGTIGLSAAGKNNILSKIYIFGSILHVIYAIPLIYFYQVSGLIFSVIITESILTVFMAYFSLKEN